MNSTDRTADETAIRHLIDSVDTAWNNADPQAFGAAFTPDADYITFVGTHYRGRQKIAEIHDILWRRFLKGSRILAHITGIRFLTADVAVITSTGRVLRSRASSHRHDKVQTWVATRDDGTWRIAAFHNCKRRPLLEWISNRTDAGLTPNAPPLTTKPAG